ncbi:glycosyltransferase family 2 protein [Vibrio parahaemolyticus]|uniref:Glycosyl transferase n=2 Tax=Vibrio parahaemolyticus TaxID=670 RepID=A0A5P4S851_VIBPH|nr:glycosyltransferase family 2 protein [Vibrio parahaemolyticus]EJE4554116.1 glycosyltransferase family 2 protein [Vibrio parahaemolyticus]QFC18368.1 glycosyl transferase [Vibrio parahaemolyticus]QOS16128.1 putative glycosyltransferase EpsH [Vibrio parahaemolyticus]HCH0377941.1 glycosyltransferase family 2 protein [Vibrio parahaemolyticus]HCH1503821.1 glycosyltransferase family 2 protein [Vibrio parahaemolyticus]
MKVSVVIPVYNVEKYVRKSLNSVLNQSYSDLEILVVNDGSTDSSHEICIEVIENDPRVTYITQKNQGLSMARNVALKQATGELLMFLDSDDYLLPDAVRLLVEQYKKYQPDVIVAGHKVEFGNKVTDGFNFNNDILTGNEALLRLLANEIPHVAWGKIFSRRVYSLIQFPVGQICEDLCEIAMSLSRSKTVLLSNVEALVYLRRAGSIMHSYKKKAFKDAYSVHSMLEERLAQSYEKSFYQTRLDAKYVKMMVQNVNLAIRANDFKSAKEIVKITNIDHSENRPSMKFVSKIYALSYYVMRHTGYLYFILIKVFVDNIKYRLFKVE